MHKLLFSFIFLLFYSAINAQQPYWQRHDDAAPITTDKAVARKSFPTAFKLFDLTTDSLRKELFTITGLRAGRSTIISLPNADGGLEEFEIVEASNFEPALQARFPEIRAFSGKGITDKYASLKLSISPQGIQTMVFRTEKETEFIEPYSNDHLVYAVFRSQRRKGELPWTCSTPDQQIFTGLKQESAISNFIESSAGELKTMRLAQSVTAEYSNYFGATSAAQVALVLAAINATLTRCNGVYEKDLALHLNLIANTANVIYYNPITDPYSDAATGAGGAWNGELQSTLTSVIGEANYDIGHLFGASGGGGNAGCIGCVCVNGSKGSGFTSPADAIPQGDNFDIDYVVHEVGHQLGANHTFSFQLEGTGVNKEVGSGITIMGYAGITSQDVAPHSIDIYHQASIAQIQTNLAGKTCPVTTNITANNIAPVVNAGSDYTIPISTPFALTGSATDANPSDVLTYCWEQNDNSTTTGANSVASATKLTGPNWISFSPSISATRLFPKLQTILAGLNVSGPLTGGDAGANTEALSSVSRTLNFRLTVRDNHAYSSSAPVAVGQTQFDDMVVTVTNTAGPFAISSPNTALTWAGGSSQTITWSVANTNIGLVNCANVKISLSTDGGQTFPTVLAASTSNDGTETITMPVLATTSSTCRIKVEAVGNIFFDISDNNFILTTTDLQFESSGTSQKESTTTTSGCRNYKDYTVNMKVMQALSGSGSAIATLNVAASPTATRFVDFDFTTNGNFTTPDNTISFAVGGATTQAFTIRIYDDASVESIETFVLNYTLNAGATDAKIGSENQTYSFTITDNDVVPHGPVTPLATLGSGSAKMWQPFRGDYNDARTQVLLTNAELNAAGIYDGTISNITELAFNVVSKVSTIAYTGFTIKMKNTTSTSLPGGAAFETGTTTVWGPTNYSTVAGTNNFVLTTPFAWDSTKNLLIEFCYNNANGTGGRSFADTVSATTQSVLYNQYDRNTVGTGCALTTANYIAYDRPNITLKQQAVAQTAVETVFNSTQSVYLGPYADIYIYSSADNELIARIENLGSFDYGCTQVTVDRDGSAAVQFWNNNSSNYLLSKSIKIVPTNTTSTGNYKVTLYYTTAEITGWQTATSRSFTNNQVVRVSNGFYIPDVSPGNSHVADVVITGGTTGTLGTHSKITGEFANTGFSGFGAGYPCSPLSGVLIWTGAADTDWANPANWACGVVPGPTSDVQINGSLVRYPVVNTDVTIRSLLLKPGSSFNVATGRVLTITN